MLSYWLKWHATLILEIGWNSRFRKCEKKLRQSKRVKVDKNKLEKRCYQISTELDADREQNKTAATKKKQRNKQQTNKRNHTHS